MPEKELMHWLVTVVVPIVVSAGGFAMVVRSGIANLEHRLTTLEAENKYQSKTLEAQDKRLNKHDEEQKTMLSMIEQIKNLSEDMREFKADLKEIKDKL